MFHIGQQIGIYTLIKRVGRGGFGEVWLAERRAKFVTTQVAVKLPLDEQVDHAAIEQEAQLWAQASGHPNVMPIIEANDYDGQIVIVSEYAPDGSLEQLLKNNGGALPIKRAVELVVGILNGLEFLHSRKIIHRDLKPANILLQGDTPRLMDFGISRAMRTTSVSANIAGTPKYMAPEAFDGKRDVRTDVWSVGVLLYQMLAGRLPFPQEHYGELIGAIVTKGPAPLPEAVPASLRHIVAKALSKNPVDRYASAREMRDKLDGKSEEQSTLTVVRAVPPPVAPNGRNPLYVAAPVVVLLLFIITGGVYWLGNRAPITAINVNANSVTAMPASTPSPAVSPSTATGNKVSVNRIAATPAPAASPAASTSAATIDKVGVAECDDYLAKIESCVNSKTPKAARAQFKKNMEQTRASWRSLAANPQTRGTLAAACKTATEQARETYKAYGCKF